MSIALKMQKALIGPGAAGQGLRSDPGISQGREHLEFIGDLIISQFQLAAVVDAQHICAVFGRHTVVGIGIGIVFPGRQKYHRKRGDTQRGSVRNCCMLSSLSLSDMVVWLPGRDGLAADGVTGFKMYLYPTAFYF